MRLFSSIHTRLSFIIGTSCLLALGCVFLAITFFYRENVNILAYKEIQQAERLINEQIRFDTDKLGAALAVLANDQDMINIFASADRNALSVHMQPLFERLKSGYGITHLYFHRPNGTVFLRVHKPELFGDIVYRTTFRRARESGRVSSGLELGKTAFALRAVSPVYLKGALVGYVELGEEIDHFMQFLKSATGNDYTLVVQKRYIDRTELSSVQALRGFPDSWERMRDFVDISTPVLSRDHLDCFDNNKIMSYLEHAGYDHFRSMTGNRICGGFPVKDANGTTLGAMVTLIDVSHQTRVLTSMKRYSTILSFFLITATCISVIALVRRHILTPIRGISRAAQIFATGDLKEHRITVNSNDEIGRLAESINEMARQLDHHYSSAVERSEELEKLNHSLESLATTDGLTGIYNHRYLFKKLTEEIIRSRRYNHNLTLIMSDVDHFKTYNDTNGHLNGDTLLKEIAGIFIECTRDIDIVARYGGEEFAIILPETAELDAYTCAERIRTRIETTPFPHTAGQPDGKLTMSFGIARLSDDMSDAAAFVARADSNLYRAKRLGRNRIEL